TAAYDLALDAGLTEQLAELLGAAPAGERTGEAIRERIRELPIPPEVEDAIVAAYLALGGEAVAVRSSATAEDLPEGTFAGQHDTFLNVVGEAAVLNAVRQCWASLWTDRAIAYRDRQGLDHRTVKLAVVVQRLVPAEVAGVLFTANPVTGARDEIVVDASPGLGEAIVAGLVTPDHYVIHKPTLRISERKLGRSETVIRARDDGGTVQTRTEAPAGAPALADEAIRAVARLGVAIEKHYGAPQDVEWARANGKLYALQARPITALPSAPSAPRPAPRRRFGAPDFAAEIFPIRPYPLDLSTHTRTTLKAVGDAMAAPLGISFPSVEETMVVEDAVAIRLKDFRPGPTRRVLYKPWLSLWQRRHYDVARWQEDPILAEATRRARALEARDLARLSWEEVLATFREALALGTFVARLRDRYFPPVIRDNALLWLLLRLAGANGRFGALISGADNRTLALNRRLEELAARIRASATLRAIFAENPAAALPAALAAEPAAQDFRAAFAEFLRDHGHREFAVSLMSQPTWKDAPEIPLGILQALASAAPPAPREEQPAWERARQEVLAGSPLLGKVFPRTFARLLDQARRFGPLREDTHYLLMLPLPTERRCALELGRRLVETGTLAQPEDVFHLTLDELEAAGQPWPPPADLATRLSAAVARRQARREALADQPFVARAAEPPEAVDGALLSGTPGSAGIAEGPVCVVSGPTEFGKLKPGDVLVAPFTNPSWTPLFRRAAAVVVDTGASMSHAAIVAREYHVPAVMGTRDATRVLVDGQRVRVDGTRGLVFGI
ncbi:MAG TPA: PEP/pyruvate-binding domain-containing protein, partial [Chloroflexota bacterium]|nr:PEP/pyruvate-binding domain-containing protein [Chloroflexota bacterium]